MFDFFFYDKAFKVLLLFQQIIIPETSKDV